MMSPTRITSNDHSTSRAPVNFEITPPGSPRPADTAKSQCSSLSDADNYELNGDNDIDADSGISSDRNVGDILGASSPSRDLQRQHPLRTSLRRSSPSNYENLPNRRWGSFRHNGRRQLGSNALASSSFNSSGWRSNPSYDTTDDMYSDASIEEGVHDLHNRFQALEQEVGVLRDSTQQSDERYTRAKADNAALQARVIMLEEQLRDTEIRSEERLQDEQRRSKELLARMEREKQLQLENASIRLQSAESECSNLKEELSVQRARVEKLETERRKLADQIHNLTDDVISAKELANSSKEQERRLIRELENRNHLIDDLSKEIERLRSEARTPALPTTSPETLRLEELHEEMTVLRAKNSELEEANEELQASLLHAGLEQGKKLTAAENNLAAELEAMSQDENYTLPDYENLEKIQQALKEQQEVNIQLRSYIDGILLNIVENYPQLLEVKQKVVV